MPRRISYDNLRIAVARITGGRGREVTDEFRRLRSHYLFEAHFCLVRRPNEKGHVETLVGYARRNFLVPVPAVHGGLEPLNERLAACCREELGRRLRGKPATKGELLDEERVAFLPLPAEAFLPPGSSRPANSLSLVRFDTNDYSVPTAYAHRKLTAVGTVDTLRIVAGDRVVAEHRRCWGRERVFYYTYPLMLSDLRRLSAEEQLNCDSRTGKYQRVSVREWSDAALRAPVSACRRRLRRLPPTLVRPSRPSRQPLERRRALGDCRRQVWPPAPTVAEPGPTGSIKLLR